MASLAIGKTKALDLGAQTCRKSKCTSGCNHKNAHYALRNLVEPHQSMLRRMGYDFGGVFDPNNGASGAMPVTKDVWVKVGLDSDLKAYNLLNYLYRSLVLVVKNFCYRTVWTW